MLNVAAESEDDAAAKVINELGERFQEFQVLHVQETKIIGAETPSPVIPDVESNIIQFPGNGTKH